VKSKSGLRKKLLLVLGGLIFGLLIAEVVLRIIGYSYPSWYMTDPYRGYSLRPGVSGWYTREGKSYVRINSEGLRDREHAKPKAANTVRIAILGDSFSEAMHVPMENTFWALMEKKLKACPEFAGKEIEVINFGVSGYGTTQEFITLRQRTWDYNPDIVILAMTTFNDISDNSRALKSTEEIPYFFLHDGKLILDDSFLQSGTYRRLDSRLNRFGRWFADSFRFVQAIHNAHFVFKQYLDRWRAEKLTTKANEVKDEQPKTATSVPRDFQVYLEPRDPDWIEAWHVTEELIKQMWVEVVQHGAKFLVVTVGNDVQDIPNPILRENFAKQIGVTDLFYPDRRISALGKREGIEVLNLAPQMQNYAEQNNVYLHGFGRDIGNGHWNSAGHAVACDLITRRVCEMQQGR
jgi:hypothetical protein